MPFRVPVYPTYFSHPPPSKPRLTEQYNTTYLAESGFGPAMFARPVTSRLHFAYASLSLLNVALERPHADP